MSFRLFLLSTLILLLTGDPVPSSAQDSEQVPLQLLETPIDGVLAIYQRLTGNQIIEGQNLQGPTITLQTPEPVPRSEAVRLIEAAMLLHGYAIVPAGPNTVKILNSAAQNPRAEGLPIYTDLSQLPASDQIVSFFINLNHIPVNEAVQTFSGSIIQNPYTVILPIENNQSVMITEKTPVIRQLVQLAELIDTPQARLQREFIQLNRADAENVAEQINELLQSGSNTQRGRATPARNQDNQQNQQQNLPQGAASADAIAQLDSESVKIVADARTNRILVVAPEASFDELKQLILDFDSAVDFSNPLKVALRYVKAGDILPVLGEFLAEGDEEVVLEEGNTNQGATGRNTGGSGGTTSGGSNSLSRPDRLSETGLESTPQSLTVGKTRIIADRRNNAILIDGPPENINRASAILESLDVPAQQVFLSTVIGQMTIDDTTEFGVDIFQAYKRDDTFGGAGQSVTNPSETGSFIDPSDLITTSAFPAGAGGMVLYGTFQDTLDVFVRALKTTNNFKVLSRPTVFTTNNKKAVILSGRREPIPSQSLSSLDNSTSTNASVTTNVDFEEVALKLEVIPLINSDNEITLTIAQQNDSLAGDRIIGGNAVPIINTQELVTTVTVQNRNTVILGGLIEDSAQDQTTGIPILGDIPLLGNLFKTTNRQRPRTELIIMVQPEIVRGITDVNRASADRVDETFVGPDALDFSDEGGAKRIDLESQWRLKKNPKDANAEERQEEERRRQQEARRNPEMTRQADPAPRALPVSGSIPESANQEEQVPPRVLNPQERPITLVGPAGPETE